MIITIITIIYLQLDKADSSSVGALDKAGEENEPDFYEQAYMAS